jgi:glycosyltransferase involved in cell wall biosynthesis
MFSVLMSVYIKDSPLYLERALKSITTDQSLPAYEIVLVEDGPILDDCRSVIEQYKKDGVSKIKSVRLKDNLGLGAALNIGLNECRHDIVFRMDADDISMPERFQYQFDQIKNRNCGVLGTIVAEFFESEQQPTGYRRVPLNHNEIVRFSRWRNPINHPSVAFRKNDVLSVGGYCDMKMFEDYYLWLRMLKAGVEINNLNVVLLKMRAGSEQHSRRSGIKYARNEIEFLLKASRLKLLPPLYALANIAFKIPTRLVPRSILGYIYNQMLRER